MMVVATVVTLMGGLLPYSAAAQTEPTLIGDLTSDQVQGQEFAPNGLVTIQVYSAFGGTLVFDGSTPTDSFGSFLLDRDQHGQDLVPGLFLQVTDGTAAKVLTLAPLTIDSVDQDNDVVSGTAPADVLVEVNVFDPPFGGGAFLEVTADGSGSWSADFSGAFDITSATHARANVVDADGDSTQASKPPPRIDANLTFDHISGLGFAPNSPVDVSIDGGAPVSTPTDSFGNFFLDRSQHGQDLVPGTTITVTDGTSAKTLILVPLTIDTVDTAADTVSGQAPPNAAAGVNVFDPPFGGGAFLEVTADGSGSWSADFSGVFDITGATDANAKVADADGDGTQVEWVTQPAAPVVTVLAGWGAATVNWATPDDGGAPITGYELVVTAGGSVVAVASLGPSASSHTFGQLANGVEHIFEVVAVNDLGSGPAGTATATPFVPSAYMPLAVGLACPKFTATNANAFPVSVSWLTNRKMSGVDVVPGNATLALEASPAAKGVTRLDLYADDQFQSSLRGRC